MAVTLAHPGVAAARGYFVSTLGNDSNTGAVARPWRHVATSISRLRAGDTLYVRGGQYFEAPVAAVNGTSSAPIVIRTYPGEQAILDSGYPELQRPGNTEWELVNASLGEYRTRRSYGGGRIYGYVVTPYPYENGRVVLVPYDSVASFRATTDQYNRTGFYVGPGTFADADGRIHIRLAKTLDLKAAESRYGAVFSTDLPNPADHTLILSRATYTLRVTGSYLRFTGLTLHQAQNTLELGAGAHDLRFEGITAWMGDRSIEAEESGIHHVTVTQSRLYGDDPYWIFWSDMEDTPCPADRLRGTSIDLRAGTHDWEISYCHVRGSGEDLLGTADAEYNIRIHHNRFENAGDDALELEGALGRVDVYENFFLNNLVAVAPGQDSPGFFGPVFVYRNVMCALRNPAVNRKEGINTWNGGGRYGYEYMLKQNGKEFGTCDAHYYHNTMVMLNSGGQGINLTPQIPTDTRVANNLLVMVNGPVNGSYLSGLDQVVDGNLYWKVNTVDATHLIGPYDTVRALYSATGFEAHGLGSATLRGTDPGFASWSLQVVDRTKTVWKLTAAAEHARPQDFFLGATSPARGAGIAIPPHIMRGPLPDSRSSRDIGAIPYGTPASEYDRFPFNPGPEEPLRVDVPAGGPRMEPSLEVTPNPVGSSAVLRFATPRDGPARIELLDLQGRRVRTVLDTPWLSAGAHALRVDVRGAEPLPPGIYFCRAMSGGASIQGRFVIVK